MFFRVLLAACRAAVNLALTLGLLLCGSFGAYALWDNEQVLSSAADVQAELLKWKPEISGKSETSTDHRESFAQLRKINPEVVAWVTMEGTNIDFPVLQGKDNLSYISRDVFGNFSLAGSIFLDSRDDPGFSQSYALLYGHHMADGNMFGDLDLYKEEAFFREHTVGQLILPEQVYDLEVAACLVVGASEPYIFDPENVRGSQNAFLEFVKGKALFCREERLKGPFLALSTCSEEFTNARTVVLTRMVPMGMEENG